VTRPGLSIVIPAYRSEQTIEASLRAFLAEAGDAEIVVVDSSPDEATADVVRRIPEVQLLRPPQRLLPHAARNVGAAATSGGLLLFTDPDIYPEHGAVDALVAAWERDGGAVVAALECHGDSWLERGLHLTKFDLWLAGGPSRTLDVGPSSGILCTREAFERVGGFPDDLMVGDTVFSWRLTEAGVPIRLAPRAVFRHDHVQGWRDFLRERFARGREFAGLRRGPHEPARRTAYDVALTVSLARPARVTWRAVSNARRAGRLRDVVATAPLVVGGTLAWFAGELVGVVASPEGEKR
jgi:GT2 family glycosyltransferase